MSKAFSCRGLIGVAGQFSDRIRFPGGESRAELAWRGLVNGPDAGDSRLVFRVLDFAVAEDGAVTRHRTKLQCSLNLTPERWPRG